MPSTTVRQIVRDFLRASDMILVLPPRAAEFTATELVLIRAYLERLQGRFNTHVLEEIGGLRDSI